MSRLIFNYHDISDAYSDVPRDFEGPCQVVLNGDPEKETIICPDRGTAEHLAQLAVGEVGGYSTARVKEAPPDSEVNVTDAVEWLMN